MISAGVLVWSVRFVVACGSSRVESLRQYRVEGWIGVRNQEYLTPIQPFSDLSVIVAKFNICIFYM
jgi:hypothetical protein